MRFIEIIAWFAVVAELHKRNGQIKPQIRQTILNKILISTEANVCRRNKLKTVFENLIQFSNLTLSSRKMDEAKNIAFDVRIENIVPLLIFDIKSKML